jgi:hypothetical protein
MAFPVDDEIPGTRNFWAGVPGMRLWNKALNFALRAVATSFARDTNPEKNAWIIVIMKRWWAGI